VIQKKRVIVAAKYFLRAKFSSEFFLVEDMHDRAWLKMQVEF